MKSDTTSTSMTFWDHLDQLRGVLVKVIAVTVAFAIVSFIFKEELFGIVLAPKSNDFITYRILREISRGSMPDFSVSLINTGLAEQFVIHMKTALCAGVLCASPYILYQIFRFVSPALYQNEIHYARKIVGSGYAMFIIGVLVSYYLIFPLTFRFLGTYQVADEVANMISLQSYMSTLIMMCMSMGIVFEMPVIIWLFGKMGLITPEFLRNYRKHAIVIILIVAAVITPTSDMFTLLIVSLPMWLLYELGIFLIVSSVSDNQTRVIKAPTQKRIHL